MSMYKNISDGQVDFYCDNRLAAVDDLDYILTELKNLRDWKVNAGEAHMIADKIIKRFED